MADPRLFRLRVVFAKGGRLSMLSHLELCRALERAVRRAKLPYAVSQGFSPHMRIAFGAALPVGVGGTHEFFDLFLERYVAPQKALDALKGAIADDLMVESCEYVEHSAPAASVAFPLCTYRAVFSAGHVEPDSSAAPAESGAIAAPAESGVIAAPPSTRPAASAGLDELVVPEVITVVRKKKEKQLVVSEFLRGEVQLEGSEVLFTLEAKPTGSLRPDLFVAECLKASIEAGKAPADLHVSSITRIAQATLEGIEL